MARGKKHTAEQIVNLLRQVEVAVASGKTTALACKEAAITEQTQCPAPGRLALVFAGFCGSVRYFAFWCGVDSG